MKLHRWSFCSYIVLDLIQRVIKRLFESAELMRWAFVTSKKTIHFPVKILKLEITASLTQHEQKCIIAKPLRGVLIYIYIHIKKYSSSGWRTVQAKKMWLGPKMANLCPKLSLQTWNILSQWLEKQLAVVCYASYIFTGRMSLVFVVSYELVVLYACSWCEHTRWYQCH